MTAGLEQSDEGVSHRSGTHSPAVSHSYSSVSTTTAAAEAVGKWMTMIPPFLCRVESVFGSFSTVPVLRRFPTKTLVDTSGTQAEDFPVGARLGDCGPTRIEDTAVDSPVST